MLKLIDFYADWCGPCHQMAPILQELEQELAGKLEFVELDVDDPQHQAKVQETGVMSIPTYLIEKDGEEVARKIGAMPKESMLYWIESVLKEHGEKPSQQ
jgi:thioredoxin 1